MEIEVLISLISFVLGLMVGIPIGTLVNRKKQYEKKIKDLSKQLWLNSVVTAALVEVCDKAGLTEKYYERRETKE